MYGAADSGIHSPLFQTHISGTFHARIGPATIANGAAHLRTHFSTSFLLDFHLLLRFFPRRKATTAKVLVFLSLATTTTFAQTFRENRLSHTWIAVINARVRGGTDSVFFYAQ